MELIETKCAKCNREIYLYKEYLREKMFCTLGCMDDYAMTALSGRNFQYS